MKGYARATPKCQLRLLSRRPLTVAVAIAPLRGCGPDPLRAVVGVLVACPFNGCIGGALYDVFKGSAKLNSVPRGESVALSAWAWTVALYSPDFALFVGFRRSGFLVVSSGFPYVFAFAEITAAGIITSRHRIFEVFASGFDQVPSRYRPRSFYMLSRYHAGPVQGPGTDQVPSTYHPGTV